MRVLYSAGGDGYGSWEWSYDLAPGAPLPAIGDFVSIKLIDCGCSEKHFFTVTDRAFEMDENDELSTIVLGLEVREDTFESEMWRDEAHNAKRREEREHRNDALGKYLARAGG